MTSLWSALFPRCVDCSRRLDPEMTAGHDPALCHQCASKRKVAALTLEGLCTKCERPAEVGLLDAIPPRFRFKWKGELCRDCALELWAYAWLTHRFEEKEELADVFPGPQLLTARRQCLAAIMECGCKVQGLSYQEGRRPALDSLFWCPQHRRGFAVTAWERTDGPHPLESGREAFDETYRLDSALEALDAGDSPDTIKDLLELRVPTFLYEELASAREALFNNWPVTREGRNPIAVLTRIKTVLLDVAYGRKDPDSGDRLSKGSPIPNERKSGRDLVRLVMNEAFYQAMYASDEGVSLDEAAREILRMADNNLLALELAREQYVDEWLEVGEDAEAKKEMELTLRLIDTAIARYSK
jgi:hypothetical protein